MPTLTAVAAGGTFSLALAGDGIVYSWGVNSSGQLGIGTTTGRSSPGTVPSLTNVAAIAAGASYALALTTDGRVFAWAVIDRIAAHCEGYSGACSNTIRTARSRSSGEYLLGRPIGSILSRKEPSHKPGTIHVGFVCDRWDGDVELMMTIQMKALALVASAAGPILAHTAVLISTEELARAGSAMFAQPLRVLQLVSLPASAGVGFYILTRAFKQKRLVLALAYFPAAFMVLTYWALMLAGWMYDQYL